MGERKEGRKGGKEGGMEGGRKHRLQTSNIRSIYKHL
jgi:hypothetical protein